MYYLRAGDKIRFANKLHAALFMNRLKREGFLAERNGNEIKIIEDRIGLRKN